MVGVFLERRRQRHLRADVSLVTEVLGALMSARAGTGAAVPYDQLPITQGTASLIADALAAMPIYPVDERTGAELSQRFVVLEQPNPDEDRADTVHKLAQSMFWTGNAQSLNGPIGADLAVESITVLNPDSVSADIDPLDELHIRGWFINGEWHRTDELTHWKLNDDPRRGPMGSSPLKRCSTALDTYGWAYRYLADFFAQGGNPSLMFKTKTELPPAKITELAAEWISARKQTRPAFVPAFLEPEVPPNNGELQSIIEVLGFAAAEVARALNMPTTLVNAPVAGYSLTYSNTSDELRRWLALSLGTTWIARMERGFSKLLPPGVAARMDPTQLYRSDLFPDQPAAAAPSIAAPPAAPAELEVPS